MMFSKITILQSTSLTVLCHYCPNLSIHHRWCLVVWPTLGQQQLNNGWLIDWLIIWCYTPYRQYFGRITAHWTVDCYLGCTCMLIIHVLEGRGESDDIAFASHSVGRDLIQLLTRVLLCPPILTWGCNVCGRIRRTDPFSRFTRQAEGTMDLL